VRVATIAILGTLAAPPVIGQEHKVASVPINFDLDIEGAAPTGPTHNAYSPSFMVAGDANYAASRWFTMDLVNADFGFGDAGGSRIRLTDNSTRPRANRSLCFTSGAFIHVPLSRSGSAQFEVGGEFAGLLHKEYAVGKVSCGSDSTHRTNKLLRLFPHLEQRLATDSADIGAGLPLSRGWCFRKVR
jgi:hypothetical protein